MWAVFLFGVLTVQSAAVSASTTVCSQTKTTSALFSVWGRRNQTGHWLTDVSLDRLGDKQPAEELKESGAWQFDLSFSRSRCGAAETLGMTASITVPPPRPGPGYEFHAGVGYYKFHPENKMWAEAMAACEAEGAHLAIINSEQESAVLKDMFARYNTNKRNYAFIGFNDKIVEGQYLTIFGETLKSTGFTRWAPGQPDNSGGNPGEDCGSVHDATGGLNDLGCNDKVGFICEQEL